MTVDKSNLIRKLVPKSFHFDGYNEVNCLSSKKTFWSNSVEELGDYKLTKVVNKDSCLELLFESVCNQGYITFSTIKISFDEYVRLIQKAVKEKSDVITFEVPVSYTNGDCKNCEYENKDCSYVKRTKKRLFRGGVSFDFKDMQRSLSAYFEITTPKNDGGATTMKPMNKFLGINLELGMSKDSNIASTLMGVAVRNPATGNWYTFDAARNTRTNLANMKMGNFPIFLLPAKELNIGDLIKYEDAYYYVKSVNDNNTITLLGAADGVIREVLPGDSIIPGLNFYTKVVAFDTKSLTDTSSNKSMGGNALAAMCMMQWSKGEEEFSLDNINDNSFNGLGMCLMAMGGNNGISDMFKGKNGEINLPMLMMMGNGSGENGDMMQMLLLSQLMGGNAGANPLSDVKLPDFENLDIISTSGETMCTKCRAKYPSGTNFCSKCGAPTEIIKINKCAKCGASYNDGDLFCGKCGNKLNEVFCNKCGKKLSDGDMFCSACGNKVGSEATATKKVSSKKVATKKPIVKVEDPKPEA